MRAAAFFFGVVIMIAGVVPAIVALLKGAPVDAAITLAAVVVGGLIVWAASVVAPDMQGPGVHIDGESGGAEGTVESGVEGE